MPSIKSWTPRRLKAFEKRVAEAFLDKQIKAPVHLSGGNEKQLIDIFKDVRPGDWVFSSWRSHYHALLKGIPEEWVFAEILAGRSMYLMNAEHRLLCSSIVGGILPIACGVAYGIKRRNEEAIARGYCGDWLLDEKVWVFVGDMTARTGIFCEFLSYCEGHKLPVVVVIEDNGLSTNTPTEVVWGGKQEYRPEYVKLIHYSYTRTWPHVGIHQHVTF